MKNPAHRTGFFVSSMVARFLIPTLDSQAVALSEFG
jgi:hypothetical protein